MRHRLLHDDEVVTIHDVACGACRSGPGSEECAERFTLVLPRRGVFVVHRSGTEITADAGRALLLRPDRPYCVSHPSSGGDDCTAFAFHPALVREAEAPLGAGRRGEDAAAVVEWEPVGLRAVQRMRQALAGNFVDALAVQETALAMLGVALERSRHRGPGRRLPRAADAAHQRVVETTRQAIAAHFHERLSLGDLARRAEVSRFHLARTFRRLTGVTVHGHLNRVRLSAALERIVAGESDLTSVALECGFASHSHLTHAFRQVFGEPPSALRRPPARRELLRLSTILQARRRRAG
jgi:AraC-like DNA-binding protein